MLDPAKRSNSFSYGECPTTPIPPRIKSPSFGHFFSKTLDKVVKFAKSFFVQEKKPAVIHHLGGTVVASSDPFNSQKQLNRDKYFFEGVPIIVRGESEQGMPPPIFVYGNVLKPFVKEWMALKEMGLVEENFQDYFSKKMESDDALKSTILNQQVRYFDDAERERTEIIVEDGQLKQRGIDNDSLDLKPLASAYYAFVIADVKNTEGGLERKLYATPKIHTPSGRIQHSSFVRGGNVVSAGMIEINDQQQIIGIKNISGHYKPSLKELAYLINHLKEAGFDVSNLHVTCFKNKWGIFLSKFGLSWGIIQQRADKWFNETGKGLITQ